MNGFSKWPAMTGWRLSYCIGPEPLIAEMTKLQQFSFVCAPSMAQHAGLVALREPPEPYVKAYRRKRNMVHEGLKDQFELHMPMGAFYAFPRAPGADGEAFCRKALDRNLLIIPGSVFSEQNTHFRISFAASDETIEEGVEILNSMA
jgi:aspartate aminotransferase/aminotransferase